MLRNVFLKNLHDMRGVILAWGAGLATLAIVLVYLFSSIREDASLKNYDALIQGFSPVIRAFIGGEDIPSIIKFDGFMRLEFFNYLPLLLAIFTIVEGSAAIALEEERKTIDLLLVQPLRRWRVVVEKFAAIVVATYAIAGLIGLGLVAATRFVSVEPAWYRLMIASANAVPPALVVGALSMLGSCTLRRKWHAVILGAVFLVASFFLNVLGQIVALIRPWRYLSVFYTYSTSSPLAGDMITYNSAWLLAATFLLVAAAVFAFGRKELAI